MPDGLTISATEFKASCLDLLDQLAARKITRLEVTRHGRVVAVLTPPEERSAVDELFGAMKGSVTAPDGFDFTEPVFEGTINAAEGRIHE
jgi:antitoxin (DNA-binding transcriptional repressor) of toxin-antitoxin stability system